MSNPGDATTNSASGFDSRDCLIFVSDEPGDCSIRPARPLLWQLGHAEREKIRRWSEANEHAPQSKSD